MPIRACEPDVYPDDLRQNADAESRWLAIYTRSRQENELKRRLRSLQLSFYSPLFTNRLRSAAGRVRTSYLPMFGNYVFVRFKGDVRYRVLQTNLASQTLEAGDGTELARDVRQNHQFLQLGTPLQATIACQQELRLESNTDRLLELRAAS